MRHAFVTGGTGFLGSPLVDALTRGGWRVSKLLRRDADLRDAKAVLAVMPEDVDVVFHVAANVNFGVSRARMFADNLQGTDNLLEAALARRAKRFVFTSTAGVWGLDHTRFDEDSTRHGTGIAYLDSKLAAEASVQRAVQRGLHAVILNPGHITGPASGWDQLFAQLHAGKLSAVPPGSASWCDVDAVVAAQLAAAEAGRSGVNYLLGGCDASYAEFCALAASWLGARAPRVAPALLVRASARLGALLGGARLAPDLARIMCSQMLFSSARAVHELGYQPLALAPLLERALPKSLMSDRASEHHDIATR